MAVHPLPELDLTNEQPRRIEGVVVAVVTHVGPDGAAGLRYGDGSGAVAGRSLVPLGAADAGREVAVMFENGDPRRPFVIGRLEQAPAAAPSGRRVVIDGETVELSAEKEVVLRCGKSSITLTRSGKVLIRGAYLSSRSTGVNRIYGGSIQLN
ncbi:MAG: hypothetical protein KBD01_11795 [Acidobacteria bacterium]|nr:hypothetical protein [Acidobacteriota bacterium]